MGRSDPVYQNENREIDAPLELPMLLPSGIRHLRRHFAILCNTRDK